MRHSTFKKKATLLIPIFSCAGAVLLFFSGNWYSIFHSYSIGMLFGIFSYICFLNTLIIACRIKYLDHIFGHDRVLIFHQYLSIVAICFALLHSLFKLINTFKLSLQVGMGIIGFAIFSIAATVALLLMVDGPARRLALFGKIRSIFAGQKYFDYSRLKQFHNLTAAALLLVFFHVILASATKENYFRLSFMGAYTLFAIILYIYHKLIKPAMLCSRSLTISRVIRLNSSIVRLEMKMSFKLKHKAGQFAYFRIFSSVCGPEEHPFTISSAPSASVLSITVKNLGDYTARLGKIAEGTKVILDGPYGIFTPKQNGRPFLFIAGGIGITPFISILSEWSGEGICSPTTLIWSVKRSVDFFDLEFFKFLKSSSTSFRFVAVCTSENNPEYSVRRINAELIDSILEKSHRKEAAVYICGPALLRNAVIGYCKALGVASANIHYEKFSF